MISSSKQTEENITAPDISAEVDSVLDNQLRPKQLSDYIGQESVKQNLHVLIQAAKKRGEQLEHFLWASWTWQNNPCSYPCK